MALQQPQPQVIDSLKLFFSVFAISSFAGLAALLRSGKVLTTRSLLSAMLNSGLLGLGIAFIWHNYFAHDNIWFLVGVSLLAGLGGMTVLDFLLVVLRQGGVNISVRADQPVENPDHDAKP